MKKTIIPFIAAALCFSVIAYPSSAAKRQQPQAAENRALPADAASKEQLQKLFEVIGVQKQMQSMLNSMAPGLQQMMQQGGESEKQKAEMAQLQAELLGKMMSAEFLNRYLDLMVPAYQRHFTKSDVDQIIAFYSSAAGQKFVNAQPLIMQETFPKIIPMMQQHLQNVMQEVNYEQRLKAIMDEGNKTERKPK